MLDNNVVTEGLVRGVSYDTEPDKTYLILIDGIDRSNDNVAYRDWEIVTGRQEAYDYIKNLLSSNYADIDIKASKIIVDSDKVKISDGISIYAFMKNMKDKNKVIDYSSFDITAYLSEEEQEIENVE